MTVQQLKMWSRETVRLNRIEPAETENLSNSQKCLITLHIVGWVIIKNVIVREMTTLSFNLKDHHTADILHVIWAIKSSQLLFLELKTQSYIITNILY